MATSPILLTVKEDGGQVVADVSAWPGSPRIGRGDSIYEALGRWLHANRDSVGVKIELDMSAFDYEMRRRIDELGQR